MSSLIRTHRLRAAIRDLPLLDVSTLAASPERERALLLLTVLANGWVWAGDAPDLVLPAQIAAPLCALAGAMGRPPIVHYASIALNNWRRSTAGRGLAADQLRMQVQFTGGADEDGFFMGSLAVELAGAPVIGELHRLALGDGASQAQDLVSGLGRIVAGLSAMSRALALLGSWCDPRIYRRRIRPFLAGWPAPGVIYQGVSMQPRSYIGGSAGQSPLLQSLDAALGVRHSRGTAAYLEALRDYMQAPHRRLIEDLGLASRIRIRAMSGSAIAREAYNETIEALAAFREQHTRLAATYIDASPRGGADGVGTGGTLFTAFLGATLRSTREASLGGPGSWPTSEPVPPG